MPNYGPVHKLIVREVGEPYGPLDTGEFKDYEVEHPAECKQVHHTIGVCDESGVVVEYDTYDCGVEWSRESIGLRWSLHYTGTPVTEPGEYLIQAWSEKYVGFEYTEYDSGIALVEPPEQPTPVPELRKP
jgi:hypothetical protein